MLFKILYRQDYIKITLNENLTPVVGIINVPANMEIINCKIYRAKYILETMSNTKT